MKTLVHEIQLPILNAFLNSFLRDYHADDRVQWDENVLSIKLNDSLISLRLHGPKTLDYLSFSGDICHITFLGLKKLSFVGLVKFLEKEFFKKKNTNFSSKVESSLKTHKDIIEHYKTCNKISNKKNSLSPYLRSEQSLFHGHPVHPYPKLREGMSSSEQKVFAPEFQSSFKLIWVELNKVHLASNLSSFKYIEKVNELINFDLEQNNDLQRDKNLNNKNDETSVFLPFHPWQFEKLREKKIITDDEIISLKYGKNDWYPLSSLRTLYHPKAPYQLKFSLDIKMTNSKRILTERECERAHFMAKILQQKSKHLYLEPFYATFMNNPQTLVQFRENKKIHTDRTQLLSFLVSESLEDKKSQLSVLLNYDSDRANYNMNAIKWFKKYFEVFIKELIRFKNEEHILLGAHAQNILIEFDKNNLPVSFYYRDFQGSGFTSKALEVFKDILPLNFIKENILIEEEVNKVFGYYFAVNNIFLTISALANKNQELLEKLTTLFRELLENIPRDPFINYLLNSEYIWQKGNFRCSIEELNENTLESPWEIYNKYPNPFSIRGQKARNSKTFKLKEVYQASFSDHQLSFHPFDLSKDLDIFHKWHQLDFVSEFWELNRPKDELEAYINKLDKNNYSSAYMFKVNNHPVGYFEFYNAHKDRIAPFCTPGLNDMGLHLLIGEQSYLQTQFVYGSILHATKFLFTSNKKVQKVFGEPRSDNKKILTLAKKLPGWQFVKEFDFPHKKAALLECTRERFFNEVR